MPQTALTNRQKIATLLLSLGEEQSAQILGYLEPEQVVHLSHELASVSEVPNEVKRAVLREFRALVNADSHDRMPFAGDRLELSSASVPLRALASSSTAAPPAFLSTLQPERAAELLADEPLQIVARLLTPLPAEKSAAIQRCMPETMQPVVSAALTQTASTSPELYHQLEQALRVKAHRRNREEQRDGQAALADIFQQSTTTPAFSAAYTVEMQALHFDDLLTFDRTVLQAALNRASMRDLCLALRGADARFTEQLLEFFPFSRRVSLQNRVKGQQPVTLHAILDAQQRIIRLVLDMQQLPVSPNTTKEHAHA